MGVHQGAYDYLDQATRLSQQNVTPQSVDVTQTASNDGGRSAPSSCEIYPVFMSAPPPSGIRQLIWKWFS